jgi:DNA replication protein DnaC
MLTPAPQPACPRCNGSGWIPLPGDKFRVDACDCQGDLRRRQRLAAAGIPKRYLDHCTLEGFNDMKQAVLISARRRVQEFVDAWPMTDHGRGLLLMGSCGVGKTHLAVAALVEIIDAGKTGKMLFTNFQDLNQEIQASFDDHSSASKSEILRPLLDADLLVLDELGSQKPTTFVQDILYYIINTRYNGERTTIFTTNYTDELSAGGGEVDQKPQRLVDRIGERLRSRLYEMSDMVAIRGVSDYRIAAKQSRNVI